MTRHHTPPWMTRPHMVTITVGRDPGKHYCHALRCTTEVPLVWFMCGPHWHRVPKSMQRKLLRLYRPGQEVDKQPSQEYVDHAWACVQHVASLERPVMAP